MYSSTLITRGLRALRKVVLSSSDLPPHFPKRIGVDNLVQVEVVQSERWYMSGNGSHTAVLKRQQQREEASKKCEARLSGSYITIPNPTRGCIGQRELATGSTSPARNARGEPLGMTLGNTCHDDGVARARAHKKKVDAHLARKNDVYRDDIRLGTAHPGDPPPSMSANVQRDEEGVFRCDPCSGEVVLDGDAEDRTFLTNADEGSLFALSQRSVGGGRPPPLTNQQRMDILQATASALQSVKEEQAVHQARAQRDDG